MSADHWAGLGARGDADDEQLSDFEQPLVQRTVPAASAPRVVTTAANSPFNLGFRLPGSAAEDASDSAAEQPPEEKSMPKADRQQHPIKQRTAQYQIIQLLVDSGPLEREALREQVQSDVRAFDSALYNARKFDRIAFNDKDLKYHFKSAGKAWLQGSAGKHTTGTKPRRDKVAQAPKPATTGKKARPASAPAQAFSALRAVSAIACDPVVERSFRCAVYSDGGFHLAKNGAEINLTQAEHAEMLRYLERMADEPGR
jgi:hypothetical protein